MSLRHNARILVTERAIAQALQERGIVAELNELYEPGPHEQPLILVEAPKPRPPNRHERRAEAAKNRRRR